MCAQYGGAVPIYRNVVVRRELLARLGGANAGPTLISAPSGHGKTVLAAQLARCFDAARWIDCGGEAPDQGLLLEEVAVLLELEHGGRTLELDAVSLLGLASRSSEHENQQRRCLVLDDVGMAGSRQVAEKLWLTAQVLSQAGCSLVITSVDGIPGPSQVLRHFELCGAEELRLTREEALSIAAKRADLPADTVESVWEETTGHAALFAVMLQACGNDGVPRLDHPRLSAWIDHVASSQLTQSEAQLLWLACLLGKGRTTDLRACRVSDETATLARVSAVVPLLRVIDNPVASGSSGQSFVVHELLVEYALGRMRSDGCERAITTAALEVLTTRSDWTRLGRVVDIAGSDEVVSFLLEHGFEFERMGGATRLSELFDMAPLASVMAYPRLLLLWADVLLDCDEFEESLSKARAARVLAEHEGDMSTVVEAIATALDALRLMNRWDDASSLFVEGRVIATHESVPESARASMSRAGANMLILAGEYDEAEQLLRQALAVESGDPRFASDVRESSETLALIPCFARGDMFRTARALSPWAALDEGRLAQRVDSRGNLAAALVEVGRIERASAMLREILCIAGTSSLVCYLPVLGCAQFAEGLESVGLATMADGIAMAAEARAELEAAQNRVFQAMLLRAAGRAEDALTSAERAHERLCVQDYMDFRRLAALEVAASLLALGDPRAARAWAEPVVAAGFGENAHHAFRAAMILAECDRVNGDFEAGGARIAQHAQHVRSENSNFQAAMYARAFPGVLGMITGAVGAKDIPVHLLRMVPAESAERVLRASRGHLDSQEWATLGTRLMGEQQFDAFVRRGGRAICRVKVFGGLEVSIGDRMLHERDWKKRKARTLFAILVLNRGQEVAREQLLDHIWGDLSEERARNNFYVAWSTMKGALMGEQTKAGPCPYVDNSAGRCRIVPQYVRSDIDEFEELVSAGREAESEGDTAGAIEAYERVASVYRGELLPGDMYDDWFSPLRDRYRFDFLSTMLRLVDLLLERGDPSNALVFARRGLMVDPTREDFYQAALRCQIAAGQRSAAVETFVQCKTQLAEELGLDPSAGTIALYQQVLVMEERPRYYDSDLST